MTHASGVEVDERRPRARVEADAAGLHAEADGAALREVDTRNEEVECLALHMEAVLGDAVTPFAQPGVGLGRAVAGYDLDGLGRAGLLIDLPHQVEEVRVHLGRVVLADVAQDAVDLCQAVLVVNAMALE